MYSGGVFKKGDVLLMSNILHVNMVDVLSLCTYLNWPPKFEWYVIRCASKYKHKGRHMFERDWTMCSKYDNRSNFSRQRNRRDLYDHLMSTRIFTMTMKNTFI